MAGKKSNKKEKFKKPKAYRGQKLLNSVRNIIPDAKLILKDDGNKLSDVITDFAGPLLNMSLRFSDHEKMLSLAILIWNMCIVHQSKADKVIEDFHKNILKDNNQAIDDADEIINYLIARKKHFYKDDKRFIVSYNVKNTKQGLHLEVAYSTET